jgi:hypothetical protein
MIDIVTVLIVKALGPIGHDSLTLRGANLGTQICLGGLTKDARCFATLGRVAWNNMITDGNTGDALTYRLDYTTRLVTENAGEQSFWIVSVQSVHVCVTERIGHDLDPDFPCLGRVDSNDFFYQRLFGGTCHHGLALDGFSSRT